MPTPSPDKLNGVLKRVCGLLLAFVASHIGLQLASIPVYYQRVTIGTVPTVLVGGEVSMSNSLVAQWATERGMTLQTYALYSIALNVVITLGFAGMAVLILWKARREWFHWFTALVLLFYPSGGLWEFTQVSQMAYHYVALGGLLWPSFLLFLYLFPNGRAVPRWTRWLMGAIAVLHLAVQAVVLVAEYSYGYEEWMHTARSLFSVVLVAFPLILVCQIYRYLRGSTLVERAQVKWFVAGLALWLVLQGVIELVAAPPTGSASTETGVGGDLNELLALLIPASIGVAILRYRLYDIDILIRRTLVYGALTGILLLVYLGSIVLLQGLFRTLTGQDSQLAVVISTLAIAALFNPLRRRIQGFIDHRFYRRRYDAQQVLAAFGASLRERDNADLDRLTGELLGVIQETMQPTHLSLWLREPEHKTVAP